MSSKLKMIYVVLLAILFAQPVTAAARLDFITHNEVLIDANPAAIWPHALKFEDWKKGAKLRTADGSPPRLGTKVSATIDGTPVYTVEYVEFIPGQTVTLRLNELDGTLIGYATLRLIAQGRSTVARWDVYTSMAAQPGIKGPEDWANYIAANGRRFDEELKVLKTLSEGSAKR